ncbi:chemotaxis-specific protein-glutamate methyltransferase CheB [Phormidium sp. FACHB-592]|uniref:Protein-glutamate methylesterase/protein-glutamine glutaminase n=1 Tax=Stenomitos frigidus AS-A4 TaxID=2933935 RepID=A0ABV0KJX0_9CYAN|nr:chemotaxis-specific protein-glutamate methyltransferase CheB [Phormidium sp. FACHB-592]MBD2073569.1 chemotaxis-specific protein-glutamate methyltransferase CheB [Phormidium sp. FACHB-592]
MIHPIRVLLVEDSPVVLVVLKRLLATAADIEVVGTACNGQEALERLPALQPDVICVDYHMPVMDGLTFTQRVMSQFPRPILVISTSVHPQQNEHNIFRLLEAGAVDIFPKLKVGTDQDYESFRQVLISKIRVLAGVKVFTRHSLKTSTNNQRTTILTPAVKQINQPLEGIAPPVKAIAIGASTGGPQALHTLLTQLPDNLALPIFCVQHISEGFLQGLVNWLAAECRLPVKIAQAGALPLPGVIYFAPERAHLEFGRQGQFLCTASAPVDGHCPSVTVMLRSAAQHYGNGLIGILLTGMGRDGASGMQDVALAGGRTIAQDEQSSVVFGMPKEAIALGAVKHVLPIDAMPTVLAKMLSKSSKTRYSGSE